MRKTFTVLTIIVFFLLAAAQAVRLAMGGAQAMRGEPTLFWLSVAGVVLALVIAIGLWLELLNNTYAGAVNPTDGEAVSRAPVAWKDPATGQRLPARYFLFASRGVTVSAINAARDKYERILVGFDAGNIPDRSLAAAKAAQAELEIYVEGPGGPTGSSWSPDERARVRQAAASVGINTGNKSWMKEWDAHGWKEYTFKQLEGYLEDGYAAAEIDNLGRVLGGEAIDPLLAFFKEYGALCMQGRLPRLVMKNITEDQMAAVAKAVEKGELPRAMFSEFHISEKGSGDRKKQQEQSARIAVRTVPSNDTFNYDAKGEFGLEQKFAAIYPKPAQPAEEQPSQPVVQSTPATPVSTAAPAASPAPAAPALPAGHAVPPATAPAPPIPTGLPFELPKIGT